MKVKKIIASFISCALSVTYLSGMAYCVCNSYFSDAIYYVAQARQSDIADIDINREIPCKPVLSIDLDATLYSDYDTNIIQYIDDTMTIWAGNIGINFGYDIIYDAAANTVFIKDVYGVVVDVKPINGYNNKIVSLLIPDTVDFSDYNTVGNLSGISYIEGADVNAPDDCIFTCSDEVYNLYYDYVLPVKKFKLTSDVVEGINNGHYNRIYLNKSLDKFSASVTDGWNYLNPLKNGFIIDSANERYEVIDDYMIYDKKLKKTAFCLPDLYNKADITTEYDYENTGYLYGYRIAGVETVGDGTFVNMQWEPWISALIFDKNVKKIEKNAVLADVDDSLDSVVDVVFENPYCEINIDRLNDNGDVTVVGYLNSTAHNYAIKHGYTFKNIKKMMSYDELQDVTIAGSEIATEYSALTATVVGDVNGDNRVSLADIVTARKHLVSSVLNPLSQQALVNADINNDGHFDAIDVNIMIEWALGVICDLNQWRH